MVAFDAQVPDSPVMESLEEKFQKYLELRFGDDLKTLPASIKNEVRLAFFNGIATAACILNYATVKVSGAAIAIMKESHPGGEVKSF